MYVFVSWWEDVRAHKLLTLRALALGTLLPWLYFRYAYYPAAHFDEWLFVSGFFDHFAGWPYPRVAEWIAGTAGVEVVAWLAGSTMIRSPGEALSSAVWMEAVGAT